ncbi:MAG: phosphate acyltransferase PlsX [Chlamydiales bacterium]
MKIAVDLMGSETSPKTLWQGTQHALQALDVDFNLVILATEETFKELDIQEAPRLALLSTPQVVEMEDQPTHAIRRKKNSTLLKGIHLLREGHVDALVTSANTGALIAASAIYLPTLPNIKKPALLAVMPSKKNPFALVDAGGLVEVRAQHLVDFSYLGAAFVMSRYQCAVPKIALLNIGVESIKGTETLREAYALLQQLKDPPFQFVGNIEGRDAFLGDVDVILTDGFTGNVFLKTAEGLTRFIFEQVLEVSKGNEALRDLEYLCDYSRYPGALVCGTEKILIKCHGSVTADAFKKSILFSAELIKDHVLQKMQKLLSKKRSYTNPQKKNHK